MTEDPGTAANASECGARVIALAFLELVQNLKTFTFEYLTRFVLSVVLN